MDPMVISLLVASTIIILLLAAGVQIGVVLALAGMAGSIIFTGSWSAGLALPLIQSLDVTASYTLMVIPLFVAMGAIAGQGGITADLFTAFYRWFGHVRGGIAVATIGSSAGMAAITGSSLAVSAAMAKLAMPELRRYRYNDRLSLGSVAMGGTLAIMIPPSITLVLYAIFAEQSVGQMLLAGILPGLLITMLYIVKIVIRCSFNPALGPAGPRFSWKERLGSLPSVIPFFGIVIAIVAGILYGIWTPTESAAAGLVMVMALCALRRRLSFRSTIVAVADAAIISASIFVVVIGSLIFSNFIALTGLSEVVSKHIISLELPPFALFVVFFLMYLTLGMFLEATSILALTVPLVLPIVIAAGWNPVWFGIILVCLMEIAAVTPPVGLNLFVMKATIPDASLHSIYMGAAPFWLMNFAAIFILYFYPEITLILPQAMTP